MSLQDTVEASMADRQLSDAEIEAFQRDAALADADQITPELFPRLWNMSAGLFFTRGFCDPMSLSQRPNS